MEPRRSMNCVRQNPCESINRQVLSFLPANKSLVRGSFDFFLVLSTNPISIKNALILRTSSPPNDWQFKRIATIPTEAPQCLHPKVTCYHIRGLRFEFVERVAYHRSCGAFSSYLEKNPAQKVSFQLPKIRSFQRVMIVFGREFQSFVCTRFV